MRQYVVKCTRQFYRIIDLRPAKRKFGNFFQLFDARKVSYNNLDSRYKQLDLTLALTCKLDPVIRLPNQCRQSDFSLVKYQIRLQTTAL